ncbi:MAG TPA: tRNA (adenosine(37)-N6)-dimethylallyltransferase MiaA [Caulobacteraceae bacterium]|nr:tRNA (adenosine(37)-N6)-dimethylallyltransferase MiaA [Caulobacteraceae bacterium]
MGLPQDDPRIWLIAGPTASGKSALALRLARAVGGEIVGADSMQLYRDLRILTARPSPEEEAQAPHHLVGSVDAAQAWSVGRWLRAAKAVLAELVSRGRPAIVVGGTGLYFKALTQGLADIPPVPPAARARSEAEFERLGEAAFRGALARDDPTSAARIAPADRQRLVRAHAVLEATGRPLSAWQAATHPTVGPGAWRAVVLAPSRNVLYARCDARLEAMLAAGALGEVKALLARELDPALPAMKAVGVRAFAEHLAGRITLAQSLARAQQETRRYAKRQMTWFRNQTPDWPVIEATEPEAQWRQVLALNPSLTPPA